MEEFWGIEVKNGESLKVSPGNGVVLHISQASLGELKDEKGKENVNLFVNVNGKKLVLGTLITNKLPQYQFDLLFESDFELSHNWKSGSVYYYGYKASKTFEAELLVGESDRNKTAPLLENEATKAPPADQPKKQNPEKKRCNICCRLFTCEQGLDDHIKAMHGGNRTASLLGNEATKAPPTDKLNKETLKTVLCSICSRLFVSEKGLEAYTKAVHDDKTAPLVGNEATKALPADQLNKQNPEYSCCIVCSRLFTSEQGLKAHIKSMHDGYETAPLLGNESMKAPPTNKEILKKVRCSICSRLLGSEKGLEDHTKAVHDKSKSKEDIPLNLETNGKTKPKPNVNNEKPTDAERAIASNKEFDAGRESVKIAETRKDLNTEDDGENTFEDVMTNNDDVAETQVVVISKKRPLESVELATVTSIPKKKSRRGKKKEFVRQNQY